MASKVNIFWFRRDLRLKDNVGFSKALHGKFPVLPIFIFDVEILEGLPEDDARVNIIFETLQEMRVGLKNEGSGLALFHGKPKEVFEKIFSKFNVQSVIANHDYEPYATKRDSEIEKFLSEKNKGFYTFKDQVIFEKDEVVKQDGKPYLVYTPYMKAWKEKFRKENNFTIYETSPHFDMLLKIADMPNLSLADIGFKKSKITVSPYTAIPSLIKNYQKTRNFPADDGTSRLGPHLRFGTVSIREMFKKAMVDTDEAFLQELIWREFFMQILWHFPDTVDSAFKKQYDRIKWRNNEAEFKKWKEGKTGYPLVDAGMRQLNQTGYMHNRVRMVTASFLCKHLLIDWRWGEAYFGEKLLDYELSSNVGNWQWVAGSGVDSAPYFRIFNPNLQLEKFDKDRKYIKKWIKEFGTPDYPPEMVEHKEARERTLEAYKNALS